MPPSPPFKIIFHLLKMVFPEKGPFNIMRVFDSSEAEKPKKTLPLFGAMKGGSKFKLKTGTIGVGLFPMGSTLSLSSCVFCSLFLLFLQKLPAKQPNLPEELFNMKELPPDGEEEEEEDEEAANSNVYCEEPSVSTSEESAPSGLPAQSHELQGETSLTVGGKDHYAG